MTREQRVAQDLNDAFMNVRPGRHFRAVALRWNAEAEEATESDEAPVLRSGLRERLGEDYEVGRPSSVADRRVIEAFMLAHHASESFLRHYLAHLDAQLDGRVPWISLVKLQGSPKFRKRLADIVGRSTSDLAGDIERAFYPGLKNADHQLADAIEKAERFCASWLRQFARFHLDTSNAYNAIKHGLSSVQTQARVSFSQELDQNGLPDPDGEVVLLEGDITETIEYKPTQSGREWVRAVRSLDPDGLVAFALVASDLLDWLWEIWRAGQTNTSAEITLFRGPLPRDVLAGHERAWGSFIRPIGLIPFTPTEAAQFAEGADPESEEDQ